MRIVSLTLAGIVAGVIAGLLAWFFSPEKPLPTGENAGVSLTVEEKSNILRQVSWSATSSLSQEEKEKALNALRTAERKGAKEVADEQEKTNILGSLRASP